MTKKIQLVAYSILMGVIIFSAYFGWIPTKLHDIPFYDSVGHFVLYGFWGYFFGNAFSRSFIAVRSFSLQNGIVVAALIAITEELLQQLSPMRTFSLYDLGFGLLGISLSCAVLNRRPRPFAIK
jgi:VanZ family protein